MDRFPVREFPQQTAAIWKPEDVNCNGLRDHTGLRGRTHTLQAMKRVLKGNWE